MFDLVALHVYLQRHQQSEKKLVVLIQAPCCVLINFKGHELYDVGDPFTCDRAFRRPFQGNKQVF